MKDLLNYVYRREVNVEASIEPSKYVGLSKDVSKRSGLNMSNSNNNLEPSRFTASRDDKDDQSLPLILHYDNSKEESKDMSL